MSVPSGWYPDPAPGSSLQRFWDGTSWTSQTREAPGTAAEPEAHAAASAPSVPAEQPAEEEAVVEAKKPRRSRRRRSDESADPDDKPSSTAVRLQRSLRIAEDRRSVPVGRQLLRQLLDLAVVFVIAAPSALVAAGFVRVPPAALTLVLAGPVYAAYRSLLGSFALRSLGEVASRSQAVIAVSGRSQDAPAAASSAAFVAAVLSVAHMAPAVLLLLLADAAFLMLRGDARQTLSDRIAGIQVVRA